MNSFYSFLVIFIWSLNAMTGKAQTILNQRARVLDDNDLVEIKYTLQGKKGEVYQVSVSSSHDNFAKPLISVTGDIGSGIETGGERTILWQPKTELEKFTGKISFEIKAELRAAPILITLPNTVNSEFRRGKTLHIAWNGGAKQEVFYVQLLKDGIEKLNIDTVTIKNIYDNKLAWKIPAKVRKGFDYQIQITSADRNNVFKQSSSFAIKPKIPLAYKCIAGGIIIAALILIPPPPPPEWLPSPPAAPR
jgi:hypothetical protein